MIAIALAIGVVIGIGLTITIGGTWLMFQFFDMFNH